MKLVVKETGEEPVIGETYMDFREEAHVLKGFEKPHKPSSTGRVYTDKGSYFPSVIGMVWIEREDHV